MSQPTAEYVLAQARRLVQHCEHCQSLLGIVLDWADRGLYDPVGDLYAMRLPGDVVRSLRALTEHVEPEHVEPEHVEPEHDDDDSRDS